MNNVTPITKAPRLTEAEVHAAAQQLIDAGEHVSSLALLKALGRGSLTTITKFLSTFNQPAAEETEAPTLPALDDLPDGLRKAAELMIVKVWAEAQSLATQEIESQREELKQAETKAAERVQEAEAFSEEQAKVIDTLERVYKEDTDELKRKIMNYEREIENIKNSFETERRNFYEEISVENKGKALAEQKLENVEKQLEKADSEINKLTAKAEQDIKQHNEQLNALAGEKEQQVKQKEALEKDNKRLEMQIAKQQLSLDQLSKDIDSEKKLRAAETKENKGLRDKAAFLEGELKVWKEVKSKGTVKKESA